MFCKYCGAVIDEDSVFCKKCGKTLSSVTAVPLYTEDLIEKAENNNEKADISLLAKPIAEKSVSGRTVAIIVLLFSLVIIMVIGLFVNTMSASFLTIYTKNEIEGDPNDFVEIIYTPANGKSEKSEYGYDLDDIDKHRYYHDFSFNSFIKQCYRNYWISVKSETQLFTNDKMNNKIDSDLSISLSIVMARLFIILVFLLVFFVTLIKSIVDLSKNKIGHFYKTIMASSLCYFMGLALFYITKIIENIFAKRREYFFTDISFSPLYLLFIAISLISTFIAYTELSKRFHKKKRI